MMTEYSSKLLDISVNVVILFAKHLTNWFDKNFTLTCNLTLIYFNTNSMRIKIAYIDMKPFHSNISILFQSNIRKPYR